MSPSERAAYGKNLDNPHVQMELKLHKVFLEFCNGVFRGPNGDPVLQRPNFKAFLNRIIDYEDNEQEDEERAASN